MLPHILLDEPGVQRFYLALVAAAIMDAEEIETAFILAAEPVAVRARGQLAAYVRQTPRLNS